MERPAITEVIKDPADENPVDQIDQTENIIIDQTENSQIVDCGQTTGTSTQIPIRAESNTVRRKEYYTPPQRPLCSSRDAYCHNCGRVGHINKHCTDPIISYGIILFRVQNLENFLKSEHFHNRLIQHTLINQHCEDSSLQTTSPLVKPIPRSISAYLYPRTGFSSNSSSPYGTPSPSPSPPPVSLSPYLSLPKLKLSGHLQHYDYGKHKMHRKYHPTSRRHNSTYHNPYHLKHISSTDLKHISSSDSSSPDPQIYKSLQQFLPEEGESLVQPEIKFLMIQDRHTPDYVQIVLGKYDLEDTKYLKSLVQRLSRNEVRRLREMNITYLFTEYWTYSKKDPLKMYRKQYLRAKHLFEKLCQGTINKAGEYVSLESLLQSRTAEWDGPDWGFPKGRRRRTKPESDIEAAIREFTEESGIDSGYYRILSNISPIHETVIGSNGITYKNIYYLAKAKSNLPLYLNPHNQMQMSEIRRIGWFTFESCSQMIREYHSEKHTIIRKIQSFLEKSSQKTPKNGL